MNTYSLVGGPKIEERRQRVKLLGGPEKEILSSLRLFATLRWKTEKQREKRKERKVREASERDST